MAIGQFRLWLCFLQLHFQLLPKTRNYRSDESITTFLQMRLQTRTNGRIFRNAVVGHTLAAFVKGSYRVQLQPHFIKWLQVLYLGRIFKPRLQVIHYLPVEHVLAMFQKRDCRAQLQPHFKNVAITLFFFFYRFPPPPQANGKCLSTNTTITFTNKAIGNLSHTKFYTRSWISKKKLKRELNATNNKLEFSQI